MCDAQRLLLYCRGWGGLGLTCVSKCTVCFTAAEAAAHQRQDVVGSKQASCGYVQAAVLSVGAAARAAGQGLGRL